MIRYLIYYLTLGLLFTSCAAQNTVGNQNELTSNTIFQNEKKLPKEIFLLIGRGGCCNGHIVTISKNGEMKYFVGSYLIPNASSDMPEIYDSHLIKQNPNYKSKYRKLSEEKINQLRQLINDEQKLRFKDEVPVEDVFVYSIYLDNRKIASGYEPHKAEFPANLATLIDLVRSEVELYELPGMAQVNAYEGYEFTLIEVLEIQARCQSKVPKKEIGVRHRDSAQIYTYDSLNRIKSAVETADLGDVWSQTFNYDRFDNRKFDEANTSMPASFANPPVTNPSISPNNNRITSAGWGYDAAGNTLTDAGGQTYIYDGENKMVTIGELRTKKPTSLRASGGLKHLKY